MNSSVCIEQRGIVENIDKGVVCVKISQLSACSGCHARSSCLLFGMKEKTIEVSDNTGEYKPGDPVGIAITQTMGAKAVIMGYLVPFLIVLFTLIVLTFFQLKEWLAGILAIATLVPYYAVLFLFRTKLRRSFTFSLKKID
ncbi:MAG: SoxR reducing system RseC family protein [Bacteroidales bacterium]|nr:SoxR reducing system RseC family protein [Bacteroidales bacterium]MBN2761525.1 SoxR reducing system RseC family protein [Bacteroidales bacterium]